MPKETTNPTVERRESDRKEEVKWKVKSDTVMQYRDRIIKKEIHDTTYISKLDSAEIKRLYDSIGLTVKKCVIQSVQLKSCSEQLAVMDTVHSIDSIRIGLLTRSNLAADTLLTQAAKQAKKDKRKAYYKGLKHGAIGGFVAGWTVSKLTFK